jgi:hypothetical protein
MANEKARVNEDQDGDHERWTLPFTTHEDEARITIGSQDRAEF